MLETTLLKQSDYRRQTWKNGRGETKEIAVDSASAFQWRVSWASLTESGPFSEYPGYDRVIVILRGGPVLLTVPGKKPRALGLLNPFAFSGDALAEATVDSPAEDFNVFARHGHAAAKTYAAYLNRSEDYEFPLAAAQHFLFCVEGSVQVREVNTGGRFELETGDTLRIARPSAKEYLNLKARGLSDRAVCLWVLIYRVPATR